MKGGDGLFVSAGCVVEYIYGFFRRGNARINPLRTQKRNCFLGNGHRAEVSGAYDKEVGLLRDYFFEVCRLKPMAFFPPPRGVHFLRVNNDIRGIGLSVDDDFSKRILINFHMFPPPAISPESSN